MNSVVSNFQNYGICKEFQISTSLANKTVLIQISETQQFMLQLFGVILS